MKEFNECEKFFDENINNIGMSRLAILNDLSKANKFFKTNRTGHLVSFPEFIMITASEYFKIKVKRKGKEIKLLYRQKHVFLFSI